MVDHEQNYQNHYNIFSTLLHTETGIELIEGIRVFRLDNNEEFLCGKVRLESSLAGGSKPKI